jgi:hypothetical protein
MAGRMKTVEEATVEEEEAEAEVEVEAGAEEEVGRVANLVKFTPGPLPMKRD